MVLPKEERFEHLGSAEMCVTMIEGALDVYSRRLSPNEQREIMSDFGKLFIQNVSRINLVKMMEEWL